MLVIAHGDEVGQEAEALERLLQSHAGALFTFAARARQQVGTSWELTKWPFCWLDTQVPCNVLQGYDHLSQPCLWHFPQHPRLIRNAGVEPHIIDYTKSPPSRAMLVRLIERMGVPVRAVIREKGTPYAHLGLADETLSDEALIDAMIEHPILINRPIVVTPKGVRLCRPSEAVLDLLPPQRGEFRKEDGEVVVDAQGRRVA